MKNLLGFSALLKILLLVSLFSFFSTSNISAEEKISEQAEIYYFIDEEENINFRYLFHLSVEEGFTTAISQYSLSFPFKDLDFDTIQSDGENLRGHREVGDGTMYLILDLNERLLNHTNPISIEIEGSTKTPLIKRTSDSRILTLPGSMSNVDIKKVEINYPESFGEIRNSHNEWIIERDEDGITIKSSNAGKVINLFWGNKIVYDFEINKRLYNTPEDPRRTFDLNIPKAHNNQKILFSEIEPIPDFAYQDAEGNIFFSYELSSDTEIDVTIKGQIEIDFAKEASEESLEVFKKPILTETKGYWLLTNIYETNRLKVLLSRRGVDQDSVLEMDSESRKIFYETAYEYVVNRLTLGDFKTTSLESYVRQGADKALENRQHASPEDYVDLLSAIYREYDVPTRMIEGYVSMLNQGFYHSWIEYWDDDKGWRSIDPALENYSKGDYFNTQLFNHITLLSRSYNYIRPRIVFFDKDEIKFDMAENATSRILNVENTVNVNPLRKTQQDVMGSLQITNTGNTIISLKNFTKQENFSFSNHNSLQVIVPGQSLEVPFTYDVNSLGKQEDIYVEYLSINNDRIMNPIDLEIREQQFWWWNPLIVSLRYTAVAIIVYIAYLILSKGSRWIEKYYQ